MSFKVKKWGCLQTVAPSDYYPGALATTSTSGKSHCFPWGGKILFLCYDAAQAACWFSYDPVDGAWTGPHYPAGVSVTRWNYHNPLYGDERAFKTWSNRWLLSYGMNLTGASYVPGFYGWDADLNFVYWTQPTIPGSSNRGERWVDALGVDASGNPCRALWQYWDITTERLLTIGPGGQVIAYEGPRDTLYWPTNQGVVISNASKRGSLWQWYVGSDCTDPNHGSNLYASYVTAGQQCSPAFAGTCDPRFAFAGTDGGVYGAVTDKNTDPDSTYTADLRSPLTAAASPWVGTWGYRRDRDGGAYSLHPGTSDLSGVDQSIAGYPVSGDVTRMSNGLYLGLGSNPGGFTASLYELEPDQPAKRSASSRWAGSAAIAWVGTWALGTDLVLRNVFDPAGNEVPDFGSANVPIEQESGATLTQTKVYKGTSGGRRTYERDVRVELRGYPTSGENWWWPGDWVDPTHYQGFWWLFADAGTDDPLIEYMPDPSWGILSPVGTCTRISERPPIPTGCRPRTG